MLLVLEIVRMVPSCRLRPRRPWRMDRGHVVAMIGDLIDAVAAATVVVVVVVMAVDVEADTMAVGAREDSGVVGVGHGGMSQVVFAEGGVTRSSHFVLVHVFFISREIVYLLQRLGCRGKQEDAASCICERNTEKYEEKKMCGTWAREKGKKLQMNQTRKWIVVENLGCVYEGKDEKRNCLIT